MASLRNQLGAVDIHRGEALDGKCLERGIVGGPGRVPQGVDALQEIAESMRDLILRCHVHTSNQHAGLLPAQKKELQQVRKHVEALLDDTARILDRREPFKYREVAVHYVDLKLLLEDLDRRQIERIHSGVSKTRLSILFYGITNACLKISEQTLQLLTIFDETLQVDEKKAEG